MLKTVFRLYFEYTFFLQVKSPVTKPGFLFNLKERWIKEEGK